MFMTDQGKVASLADLSILPGPAKCSLSEETDFFPIRPANEPDARFFKISSL